MTVYLYSHNVNVYRERAITAGRVLLIYNEIYSGILFGRSMLSVNIMHLFNSLELCIERKPRIPVRVTY